MKKVIKDNSLCTGCGACKAICPVEAIQMLCDSLGQASPHINKNTCINCNACVRVCPQMKHVETYYPQKCYVAWSTNEKDYIYSASGGIGAAIARRQLDEQANIFCCEYTPEGTLEHFLLKNENDIVKAQSSKYSHSDAYVCFQEIKELLICGNSVVFVGTPCQVAGLYAYLEKKYEQLITVDLICHGAPPNKYLVQHIKKMGIKFPVDKIRFRGEFDKKLTIWKNGSKVYQKDKIDDLYFSAFYNNMISYSACYTCKYANPKRVGDITIGDFWGLGKLSKIKKLSERPSIILVNTEKGGTYLRRIQKYIITEERCVTEGIKGNGRLNCPPGKNKKAKLFQLLYKLKIFGFDDSVKWTMRLSAFINKFRT